MKLVAKEMAIAYEKVASLDGDSFSGWLQLRADSQNNVVPVGSLTFRPLGILGRLSLVVDAIASNTVKQETFFLRNVLQG
jgi:hypothetical protein